MHTRFLEEALVGLETVLGSAFSRHEENLAGLPDPSGMKDQTRLRLVLV